MQTQHRALDDKIIDLQSRPWQNQLLVRWLKKEKLRLKEAIERLKDEMIPDLNAYARAIKRAQSTSRPSNCSNRILISKPPVNPVSV